MKQRITRTTNVIEKKIQVISTTKKKKKKKWRKKVISRHFYRNEIDLHRIICKKYQSHFQWNHSSAAWLIKSLRLSCVTGYKGGCRWRKQVDEFFRWFTESFSDHARMMALEMPVEKCFIEVPSKYSKCTQEQSYMRLIRDNWLHSRFAEWSGKSKTKHVVSLLRLIAQQCWIFFPGRIN